MSTFGQQLRAARKARGMTQATLARAANIEVTYLSKVECDKMPRPFSARKIEEVAAALGIDPTEWLLMTHKVPDDVRAILEAFPDACRFLRAAHAAGWDAEDWRGMDRVT